MTHPLQIIDFGLSVCLPPPAYALNADGRVGKERYMSPGERAGVSDTRVSWGLRLGSHRFGDFMNVFCFSSEKRL